MVKVPKIIVGCPTRNRTWILERWRDHVEQAVPGDWDLSYAFVVSNDDEATIELLESWTRTGYLSTQEPPAPLERSWPAHRLDHMVTLRNRLLSFPRMYKADLFLSLDSDILIGQDTIRNLYQTMNNREFDAVGGLTWFDPVDRLCTNVGDWRNSKHSSFKRIDSRGIREVDIIMGIKLMNPKAYNIDYSFHPSGEDLGWCKNIKSSGLTIGFDGRTPSQHVMSPEWLERKDKRLDR